MREYKRQFKSPAGGIARYGRCDARKGEPGRSCCNEGLDIVH